MKRWLMGTAAIWLLGTLALAAVSMTIDSVASRDVGWAPGPWAYLADFVFDTSIYIGFAILLIAQAPAVWWRRIGGSPLSTLGVAFACPLAIFAQAMMPRGYAEDGLILLLGSFVIGIVATVASVLIVIFVRPRSEPE